MKGSLELVCGPMFAGKSTEISRQFARLEEAGLASRCLVLVPAYDDRRGEGLLSTHDGSRVEARPISGPCDIPGHVRYLVVDEVQFMDGDRFEGDFVAWISGLRLSGLSILVAGLDRNWQGGSFDVVERLAAVADRVVRLRARCSRCGMPATRTWRRGGKGSVVSLGGEDRYESLCLPHWNEAATSAGLELPEAA